MSEKLETKKFVFTVEGETEQWYLERLRDQVILPLNCGWYCIREIVMDH